MLMLVLCSCLLSGTSISFVKVLTELIQANQFGEKPHVVVILFICLITSCVFQVHMQNKAMKFYD